MEEVSKKNLVELFTKEYSRFCMLSDLAERGIDSLRNDCDNDSDCGDKCSDYGKLNVDPYEYAMLYSAVRMATYLQELLFSYYAEKVGVENPDDVDSEKILNWFLDQKIIDSQDDVEALALLISLYYESISIFPEEDISCFSQDSDRIPLIISEQLVAIIESVASLVQTLSKTL